MLYLDSSALIKHYQKEIGTDALDEKLKLGTESSKETFTSVLTYAEIHAIVARRIREKLISAREGSVVHDAFDRDWIAGFTAVELSGRVLSLIRKTVEAHALKGADAVHLASALWLRDIAPTKNQGPQGRQIIFASSDRQLIKAARQQDFAIFNPETAS